MPVYTDKLLVYETGKAKEIDPGDSVRVTTELASEQLLVIGAGSNPSSNGQIRYVSGQGFKFYEEGTLKSLGGTQTLQGAYNGGNLLTLTANRDFEIAQPVSGQAAIVLTSNTASSWTVNGANLSISVTGAEAQLGLGTTDGPVVIGSGANVILTSTTATTVTGGTGLTLNSGGTINIGSAADSQPINIGSAGARTISIGNATAATTFGVVAGGSAVLTAGVADSAALLNLRSYGNINVISLTRETGEVNVLGGAYASVQTTAITASSTIDIGTGTSDRSDFINIGTNVKAQTIAIGNTSASTTLGLTAGGALSATGSTTVGLTAGTTLTATGATAVNVVTSGVGGAIAVGEDYYTTAINIGTGGGTVIGPSTSYISRAIGIGNGSNTTTITASTGRGGLSIDSGSTALWHNTGMVTLTQVAWTAPTFNSSWVNVNGGWMTAAYFKDSVGFVKIRGLVKWNSSGGVVQQIFQLPAGSRPSLTIQFPARMGTGVLSYVVVDTNGVVSSGSTVVADAQSGITLDNISFDTR